MVYACSLPLTPAVILSFLSSQVASLMQAYKEHPQYFTGMIPVVILYMNAHSYDELGLPQLPFNLLPPKKVRIYIETAIVVVIPYVSLLTISWSYIWLVVFPIIAIGFILALCSELISHQQQSNGGEAEAEAAAAAFWGRKGEGLEAVALVPYWALCVMGQFQAGNFTVSQFLLFFSFMLGALTMMMTRLVGLAAPVRRGVAAASELLRKASLVVLLVAVHAVPAELLGENALLFCLPEIAPVLLWLSVRLDCNCDDGADAASGTAAERIKQLGLGLGRSSVLKLLGAVAPAVLASKLASGSMDESVLYWCGKSLATCAVSGPLTLYLVFMLCQWPGPGGQHAFQEEVKLLKFWAILLLKAAGTLLVLTYLGTIRLVALQEPVASASADQTLQQRVGQKFLEFIV